MFSIGFALPFFRLAEVAWAGIFNVITLEEGWGVCRLILQDISKGMGLLLFDAFENEKNNGML